MAAQQITQDERRLRATTPLGDNVLVPVSLTGTEAVSRPFEFTVDFVSEDAAIDPRALLGRGITMHLQRANGELRELHGIVRAFTCLGTSHYVTEYRAELVPSFWFLSLSTDCRTFEEMKLTEIIEKVCEDAGVTDINLRVAAAGEPVPYVAQYRETNLQFVSRLIEEAGLYYAFEHTQGGHTLVVSDSVAGMIPAIAGTEARIHTAFTGDQPSADSVFLYAREYAVHAASIALRDHEFHRKDSVGDASSRDSGAKGERYDYVGDIGYKRLPSEAKLRIESEERLRDVITGRSANVAFGAGLRVKLRDGPLGAGAEFHLLEVTHKMQVGDVYAGSKLKSMYENTFVAIPAATPYRPARATPRPFVHGTQTAKVIGAGRDGNIDVDDRGRVLLEFPWDRGAGKGARSKHRVDVASVWAGRSWGFIQLPRVGQEVLVEYLDGDVNRPIITGRVYNSGHPLPYDLPANKTQTGWKSQSLKGGSNNFNEIRFEDLQDAEHVYVQAEKDLEVFVKNDETRKVEHDRWTTIKNDDTCMVTEGKAALTVKAGNRTVEVDKGNDSLTVTKGNIEIKATAGTITVQAGQKIELKVGGNSIVIDMKGVTIKGTMIKIEGQAQAELKSPMTKVEGSGMMEVKGAMTQVKGDAILIAKGGITMIN